MKANGLLFIPVLLIPVTGIADPANILDVEIHAEGNSRFSFSVTVGHMDSGWDHYADRWEILTPEGQFIAARTLRHPHVNEPVFTRDLGYLPIADEITEVVIRAHCSRDGYGGETRSVFLPQAE